VMCDILAADELAASRHHLCAGRSAQGETQIIDLASPGFDPFGVRGKIATGGRIGGLVDNAALATGVSSKTMMKLQHRSWDRVCRVNVRGTWLVGQAAVPLLARNPHARSSSVASDTARGARRA
ncbi:SDR family oxidoreductase, partial [Serratia ureilytica]